jgi:hypothetical protein
MNILHLEKGIKVKLYLDSHLYVKILIEAHRNIFCSIDFICPINIVIFLKNRETPERGRGGEYGRSHFLSEEWRSY